MDRIHNRELKWVAITDCHPHEGHKVYASQDRRDLELSVGKSGVIQPFTGFTQEGNVLIIDGRERLKAAKTQLPSDYKVPVWVITDPLTDAEIKWLILDIERTRKKTYVDIMNEYHLYNQLIPNRQGQKDVGKKRTQMICDLMGISTSQLNKLKRIDKIKPDLLAAVDSGLITLEGARRKADEIKRRRDRDSEPQDHDSEEESSEGRERIYQDKGIDLTQLPDCCPACNRGFATIQYEDIQSIFNVNRSEDEFQTDWLEM